MTDLRKAAEMALEFVDWLCGDDHSVKPKNNALKTREALRQALAQPEQEPMQFKCTVVDDANPEGVPLSQWGRQPEQEPVGYIDGMYGGYMVFTPLNPSAVYLNGTALYTAPPKREWIGLTDDEINDWFFQRLKQVGAGWRLDDVIKAVEAKLKEKNGG